MDNRHLFDHIPNKTAMRGFSILELLVASLLSMTVLMVVGSTYFTVCGLDGSANTRIDIRQDLYNAANMIVRGAHMTGNFGCSNMSNLPTSAVTEGKSSGEYTLRTADVNNLLLIRGANKSDYADFIQTGKVLLSQYGIDKANPVVKTTTVSSCSNIVKPQAEIKNLGAAKTALKVTDSDQNDSIATMKREMIAYAVGKLGEESGSFRFQLSNGGSWSNPQLLIKGITATGTHYIYEECPHSESTSASGVNTESFNYRTALNSSAETKSPASIQVVLSNDSIDPSKEQDNKVDTYNTNVIIRGGDVRAD